MPGFGRLGKHNNRSQQHAVAEPSPAASPVSSPAPSGTGLDPVTALKSGTGASAGAFAGAAPTLAPVPAATGSPVEATPSSALSSSTALSSSESFIDLQQQQQLHHPQPQHHQQPPQPPNPHPHLYNPSVNRPPSLQIQPVVGVGVGVGGSSSGFKQQQPQTPTDCASSAGSAGPDSANQRYAAAIHSQHQSLQPSSQQARQLYPSDSTDDLAGSAGYQQSPISTNAPEKRSTRKLFKGIFSSTRSSHDTTNNQQQQAHGSSDNTVGLASRPSKREPRPTAANTTIRQIPGEQLDTSSFDEEHFLTPIHPPPQQQQGQQPPASQQQPQQRIGTLHVQDQRARHDPQELLPATYDHQLPPEGRLPQSQPPPPQQLQYVGNSIQGSYTSSLDQHTVPSHQAAGQKQKQQQQPQPQQNAETISQLSGESLIIDTEQRSVDQQQSVPSSPVVYSAAAHPQDPSSTSKSPAVQTTTVVQPQSQPQPQPQPQQHFVMPNPAGAAPPGRRMDTDKALRSPAEATSAAPPSYRQGSMTLNTMSPLPSAPPNPAYRGDRAAQFDGPGGNDQGRNSPQPSNAERDAEGEKQFKELLTKYKNVKRLYFDGKSQIEQLSNQVETLQNAVANQRMSQSRTAWDDNEYMTRFNRLNGAINNLSFNIRKDWSTLPQWLEGYASADALKTGKQEMTAVGRAIVSRWIVEEIFNRCFHPGLDPQLSSQLKEIELSIRGNAHVMHSQAEYDALTTKVVNWRMATLDGLQKKLSATTVADNRATLTSKATANMTAYLYRFLSNPPPPGVEGSTSMIAELAVAIATNLPLESRDVAIAYPMPGDVVHPHLMEVEKTGLPTLGSQKSETDAVGEEDEDNAVKIKESGGKLRGDNLKPGISKETMRVRFAGFVALEVRGRQVLMKAPVWTM
ncbi:hypothetical protein RJ55_00058 [Drechmeria coniospora]|nr:hypothetical protein RJ55_00058 [Drechmeria coniospora]